MDGENFYRQKALGEEEAVTRESGDKGESVPRILPLSASPPHRVFLLLIAVPDRLDLASEFQQLVALICRWFVEQNGDVA